MNSVKPRLFSLLLAFLLAFSGLSVFAEAPTAEPAEPALSSSNFFVNLELTYLDGRPFDSSVFDGKPIFINIWATWCSPCLGEMPHLNELAQEYADKITIVGLHSEGLTINAEGQFIPDEEKNQVALGVQKDGNFTYPLVNPDKTLLILMNNPEYGLQVSVLPTTWFVDGDGYIRSVETGARDKEDWKTMIDGFLTFLAEEKNAPAEN